MIEGADALLSEDETNALLAAMQTPGAGEPKSVESLDLTCAERGLRRTLQDADKCARLMARDVDRLILRITGAACETEDLPAEIVPYKVVRSAIEPGSMAYPLRTSQGGHGLLVVAPMLTAYVLERRMGAPISDALPIEPRTALSVIERRLIAPLADGLLDILRTHVGTGQLEFSRGTVAGHPNDLPTLPNLDSMLQLTFRVVPANVPGDQLLICISPDAAQAATGTAPEAQPSQRASERSQLAQAIRRTDVQVHAVLGHTESTLRELLELQEGDLLRLDTTAGQGLEVRVGEQVVLRGNPVIQRGNLALEITENTQFQKVTPS